MCDDFGIKLILDEVFTGFGRTAKPFAFHHFPMVKPDFVTMSKAITGGYIPFGAVYTSNDIYQYYKKNILTCGLTNYGHPLGLAALKAVLEIFKQPGFQKELDKKAKCFHEKIQMIQSKFSVEEIRHIGFLSYLRLSNLKKPLNQQVFIDEDLYLHAKDNVIVLAPPLIWDGKDYDAVFEKITKVIKDHYER
jgi:taurine--2-oxoglutarate transaminase